jgi:hypothetical protein
VAPVLFDLCEEKEITVYNFLVKGGDLSFSRWLVPLLFEHWMEIVDKAFQFNYQNVGDIVSWRWAGKKSFTTKSVYNHLTSDEKGDNYKHIWKSRIPYKIKTFTGLMENNAILTKDNIIKRKWTGDPTCLFCNQAESLEHLFFQCTVAKCVWGTVGVCLGTGSIPGDINQYKRWIKESLPGGKVYLFGFTAICWAMWKCRNKAVFDKKWVKHPAEIVIYACSLMLYWAGMFGAGMKTQMEEGVGTMLKIAYKLLAGSRQVLTPLMLQAPQDDQMEEEDDGE